jgi:hypothetical protein
MGLDAFLGLALLLFCAAKMEGPAAVLEPFSPAWIFHDTI